MLFRPFGDDVSKDDSARNVTHSLREPRKMDRSPGHETSFEGSGQKEFLHIRSTSQLYRLLVIQRPALLQIIQHG
jgi:hypothetical protein